MKDSTLRQGMRVKEIQFPDGGLHLKASSTHRLTVVMQHGQASGGVPWIEILSIVPGTVTLANCAHLAFVCLYADDEPDR